MSTCMHLTYSCHGLYFWRSHCGTFDQYNKIKIYEVFLHKLMTSECVCKLANYTEYVIDKVLNVIFTLKSQFSSTYKLNKKLSVHFSRSLQKWRAIIWLNHWPSVCSSKGPYYSQPQALTEQSWTRCRHERSRHGFWTAAWRRGSCGCHLVLPAFQLRSQAAAD